VSANLFIIAIVGILGMTWLFPFLAIVISKTGAFKGRLSLRMSPEPIREISILLPAHNESDVIGDTLASISEAIKGLQAAFPELKARVIVGADRCTDETALIARSFTEEVYEFEEENGGKWLTLSKMLKTCNSSDWIVLADAGIIWKADFLLQALPHCLDEHTIAVAPTYRNESGGILENVLWAIERHFKTLESLAGGPISIHGATVLYRRTELQHAFAALGSENWLNDDVILPLYLRVSNPERQIVYLSDVAIHDSPHRNKDNQKLEFVRRRRMVVGNLQWIRMLIEMARNSSDSKINFSAIILSMRRVFRLFWAYWGAALVIALIVFLGEEASLAISLLSAGVVLAVSFLAFKVISPFRVLLASGCASLLAPYYLLAFERNQRSKWR